MVAVGRSWSKSHRSPAKEFQSLIVYDQQISQPIRWNLCHDKCTCNIIKRSILCIRIFSKLKIHISVLYFHSWIPCVFLRKHILHLALSPLWEDWSENINYAQLCINLQFMSGWLLLNGISAFCFYKMRGLTMLFCRSALLSVFD